MVRMVKMVKKKDGFPKDSNIEGRTRTYFSDGLSRGNDLTFGLIENTLKICKELAAHFLKETCPFLQDQTQSSTINCKFHCWGIRGVGGVLGLDITIH